MENDLIAQCRFCQFASHEFNLHLHGIKITLLDTESCSKKGSWSYMFL